MSVLGEQLLHRLRLHQQIRQLYIYNYVVTDTEDTWCNT